VRATDPIGGTYNHVVTLYPGDQNAETIVFDAFSPQPVEVALRPVVPEDLAEHGFWWRIELEPIVPGKTYEDSLDAYWRCPPMSVVVSPNGEVMAAEEGNELVMDMGGGRGAQRSIQLDPASLDLKPTLTVDAQLGYAVRSATIFRQEPGDPLQIERTSSWSTPRGRRGGVLLDPYLAGPAGGPVAAWEISPPSDTFENFRYRLENEQRRERQRSDPSEASRGG
jgi:hypothetical protein